MRPSRAWRVFFSWPSTFSNAASCPIPTCSQIFAKAEEDDAVTDLNEGELLKGPEGAEETKAEESDLALLRHTREQLKERLQAVQETQGPARWLFDKVPSPVCCASLPTRTHP
jgi:hypothetical protein